MIELSYSELLVSIENLRLRLHNLIDDGFTYSEVLKVSQELDKLIVEYHRVYSLSGGRDEGGQFPCHLREKCYRGRFYFST